MELQTGPFQPLHKGRHISFANETQFYVRRGQINMIGLISGML